MTGLLSILPDWLVGGFGVGAGAAGGFWVFGAIKWGVTTIFGRLDKREAALDEGMLSLLANLRLEVDRLATRLGSAETEIEAQRTLLRECEQKHGAAQAEVARLTALMQGYGDAKNRIQTEVAAVTLAGREAN